MRATTDTTLAGLGWRPFLARSRPHGAATRPARVMARDRGRLLVHDGHEQSVAMLAGRLSHLGTAAVTGDWVELSDDGMVTAVLPRQRTLDRPGDGVVAANVDVLLVAHALAQDGALARLPRFVAMAAAAGCAISVLLTKADLLEDVPSAVQRVREAVGGAASVLPVSAAANEGIEAVRASMARGTTAALVGMSGAGKSTLTNALLGQRRQATGAVRDNDGRGRHVTARRELIPIPGAGLLLDSPGVRLVPVPSEATSGFPDIDTLAQRCRFADCAHDDEPGCAVLDAIERGSLPHGRLQQMQRLEREADFLAARTNPVLRRRRRDQQRDAQRAYRQKRRS